MKKQIAILATLMVAGSLSAFGQGYVAFSSALAYVIDEYSTPGVGTSANSGGIDATFLWAATTATDPLGAGLATTGVTSASSTAWTTVATMLSSDGWTLAQNVAGSSPVEADNSPISTVGALNYGTLNLGGITGGNVYQLVVIAWYNNGGTIANLSQAEQAGTIGWSSAFDYTTAASSTGTLSQFSATGQMPKFGVVTVPEPTTLALAGLGGLSMLFLRRRKA